MGNKENKNRTAIIDRKTTETDINLFFNIDGSGSTELDIPIPFLKHMLESFAKHGDFDLKVKANGDIENDPHHLVEDIGICLGSAVNKCLMEKVGITRFGFAIVPMDESEVTVSIDVGGRPFLRYSVDLLNENIGNMPVVLFEDFFKAFAYNALLNIHITKNVGINSHHIVEAVFKAFGFALKMASRIGRAKVLPSTKGLI